uniref:BKTx n=1 Tax=Hadrurus spadix TaxID=141984 RepID=A0A1W7RAY0_9SCOR
MVKNFFAAFLIIMLISSLVDGKSTVGQKLKKKLNQMVDKVKEVVNKSEYMCPLVSSYCKQHCARLGKSGECDLLECTCS